MNLPPFTIKRQGGTVRNPEAGCLDKTCDAYCITCANRHAPQGEHYVRTCTGTLKLKKLLKCEVA